MTKMTGFGIDGQNGARELDFAQVRGEFDNNDTVKAIREHMKKKEALGDEIIAAMHEIPKKVNAKNETEVSETSNFRGSA
jgi:transcriptional regulator NrdR family protein